MEQIRIARKQVRQGATPAVSRFLEHTLPLSANAQELRRIQSSFSPDSPAYGQIEATFLRLGCPSPHTHSSEAIPYVIDPNEEQTAQRAQILGERLTSLATNSPFAIIPAAVIGAMMLKHSGTPVPLDLTVMFSGFAAIPGSAVVAAGYRRHVRGLLRRLSDAKIATGEPSTNSDQTAPDALLEAFRNTAAGYIIGPGLRCVYGIHYLERKLRVNFGDDRVESDHPYVYLYSPSGDLRHRFHLAFHMEDRTPKMTVATAWRSPGTESWTLGPIEQLPLSLGKALKAEQVRARGSDIDLNRSIDEQLAKIDLGDGFQAEEG